MEMKFYEIGRRWRAEQLFKKFKRENQKVKRVLRGPRPTTIIQSFSWAYINLFFSGVSLVNLK